jgi:hypothetical protein
MRAEHISALLFNLHEKSFPEIDVVPKYPNELHIGFIKTEESHYDTTYKLSFK